jgi:hypothetical protein
VCGRCPHPSFKGLPLRANSVLCSHGVIALTQPTNLSPDGSPAMLPSGLLAHQPACDRNALAFGDWARSRPRRLVGDRARDPHNGSWSEQGTKTNPEQDSARGRDRDCPTALRGGAQMTPFGSGIPKRARRGQASPHNVPLHPVRFVVRSRAYCDAISGSPWSGRGSCRATSLRLPSRRVITRLGFWATNCSYSLRATLCRLARFSSAGELGLSEAAMSRSRRQHQLSRLRCYVFHELPPRRE